MMIVMVPGKAGPVKTAMAVIAGQHRCGAHHDAQKNNEC